MQFRCGKNKKVVEDLGNMVFLIYQYVTSYRENMVIGGEEDGEALFINMLPPFLTIYIYIYI